MITDVQKQEIKALVEVENKRLGSYAKVASKCKVSPSVLSQLMSDTYPADSDKKFFEIGNALGYEFTDTAWTLVDISNTQTIMGTCQIAKRQGLFMAISHKAGSSKSTSTKSFEKQHKTMGCFRLECREWGRKDFLQQLASTCGIDIERLNAFQTDAIIKDIADFFNQRAHIKPLLILDEADKLKPAAIRVLIPLYNLCEGQMGVVICGTDNLEKEFKNGVKHNSKGFDELHSRFGRKFTHLRGADLNDVMAICNANGIKSKDTQRAIFQECEPYSIMVDSRPLPVVQDLRRVRRCIERELIKLKIQPMEGQAA
jgi:hypothetical protein